MGKRPQQAVLFDGLFDKPVTVAFTAPDQSSDGGAILLKAVDQELGLSERISGALRDRRQPGKILHEIRELIEERIYAIACGYPDQNDAARVSRDPIFRLICNRREGMLASQATLSRLENSVRRTDLLRVAYALTDTVIERQRRKRKAAKVRRIIVDLDPTEDPTYGDQQLTFFSAYYDNWCYLPMMTTIQFDDETDQSMVAPVLRPGNAKGSLGAIAILKRLLPRLQASFPNARLFVRMDGAFATAEVLSWLDAAGVSYVVNMAKNSVLKRFAEPLMRKARRLARQTQTSQQFFGEARYKATKWDVRRRAIIKAEVVALEGRELRDNPRFVITNLPWAPKRVYRFYTARGDMENRIKELKDGLRFDLTSCSAFKANQFRELLTAAAYVLYQELRHEARATECARAQVWTLRERLIKIGVTLRESVRRILIEAPRTFVWYDSWHRVALGLGASP